MRDVEPVLAGRARPPDEPGVGVREPLRPDPDDGRAKLYLPTARGYRLLASCTRIVDDYEKWLDGVLGGDGVASLRRALIAIVEHGD